MNIEKKYEGHKHTMPLLTKKVTAKLYFKNCSMGRPFVLEINEGNFDTVHTLILPFSIKRTCTGFTLCVSWGNPINSTV